MGTLWQAHCALRATCMSTNYGIGTGGNHRGLPSLCIIALWNTALGVIARLNTQPFNYAVTGGSIDPIHVN